MAGTLTITTPATDSAGGYSTSSIGIVWSYAGTGGAVQTQYRLWMYPVGSPGSIVYDTGLKASSSTSLTVPGFATGVSYSVNVQTVDTAGAAVTATRIVVSNYTRPLPPVVTPVPIDQGMRVDVLNPHDGSRPDVVSNTVYRRDTGSTGDWTVIGSSGNSGPVFDYTTAAGITYDYFARGDGAIDSATASGTARPMLGAWVHDLADWSTIANFPFADAATEALAIDEQVLAFVGRTAPVVESGEAETSTLAVSIRLPPEVRFDGEGWWRNRKRARTTLMYRDGRARTMACAIIGPVTINPDRSGSVLTCTLQAVDYPVATFPASAYNYTSNVDGGNGVGGNGSFGKGL